MQVTVATISLERGDNGAPMLRAMQSLADQGYSACVGDGGSSPEFVERLRAMGHHVEQPGLHLRGQMESAFRAAAERGTHVFYFESDKVTFVENRLPATPRQYRSRGLDFATVGRTRRDWYTFPAPQVEIERAQSTLIGGIVGIRGDWVAGPCLMPSAHVAVLAESRWDGTNRHGWGVPWFVLGRAWRNGLSRAHHHGAGRRGRRPQRVQPRVPLLPGQQHPRAVLQGRGGRLRLARSGRTA